MAELNQFISLVLVYVVFIISSVIAEDVCVQKSPCMCVFPNGTGVDLSPSSSTTFYSVQKIETTSSEYKMSTYYFHPCVDAPTNHTDKPGDTCQQSLSLYREVTVMNVVNATTGSYSLNSTHCNYLGNTQKIYFSKDGRSIVYENPPSNTTIYLTCAEGSNQLGIDSLFEPNNLKLYFFSKDACFKQLEEPGRSFGSTLLIIFFSLVVFYLVLGVCTKKFLMGATGVEVIPNLGFWTDLPNLVKDGWAFAISGFKLPSRGVGAAASPDPNSYDSI